MGGFGSGEWCRHQKKRTVEDSLVVGMKDFRKRLSHGNAGTFTWTWRSGFQSSISYFVTWTHDSPIVTLCYHWRRKEYVETPVRLDTTPTQFGGQRWWLKCPLIVLGVPCNRRVGKLYLPSSSRYFACRQCHKLTYQSCQE